LKLLVASDVLRWTVC